MADTQHLWKGEYYQCPLFIDGSNHDRHYKKYFDDITKDLQKQDNSELYLLDIGGGNGYWADYVAKLIKPKRAIVYEYSQLMCDDGASKYSATCDFICGEMDQCLIDMKDKKFCFIFAKEAIHFGTQEWMNDLVDFCKNTMDKRGMLQIVGIPRLADWKLTPPFPPRSLSYISKLPVQAMDSKDYAIEKGFKINFYLTSVTNVLSIEELKVHYRKRMELPFQAFRRGIRILG